MNFSSPTGLPNILIAFGLTSYLMLDIGLLLDLLLACLTLPQPDDTPDRGLHLILELNLDINLVHYLDLIVDTDLEPSTAHNPLCSFSLFSEEAED